MNMSHSLPCQMLSDFSNGNAQCKSFTTDFPQLRVILIICLILGNANGQLSREYYLRTCPESKAIVLRGVERAVRQHPRMAASFLRMHFHDCFVNGCDGSVLLDDTATFVGEKTALPNLHSLRGFKVIDSIKSELESACPGVVSCADILAIAARDSVMLTGGPIWSVRLGRRDNVIANKADVVDYLPAPDFNVSLIISKFKVVGLTEKDMVTLSGAHTIGNARCGTFSNRLGKHPDPTVEKLFLKSLRKICSNASDSNNVIANLDLKTPRRFDNRYYKNLQHGRGLLNSDQELHSSGGSTRELVDFYAKNKKQFFHDFRISMIKMGNIRPLLGNQGQIRRNCRFPN
ncbi:hypothetical protein KI387_008550 [Taxus chinensis]|uniref:Peroxidase n=1 Tax=Taxus chinensis TaxID=29808 RepID=A0AA38CM98_TAXCH|nr:hypothetical protein KI387_008550 [Taxus chinensis]